MSVNSIMSMTLCVCVYACVCVCVGGGGINYVPLQVVAILYKTTEPSLSGSIHNNDKTCN